MRRNDPAWRTITALQAEVEQQEEEEEEEELWQVVQQCPHVRGR